MKSNIPITFEKPLATVMPITESEISDDSNDETDEKADPIDEEKKENMVRTKMDISPKKYNMKIKKDFTSTTIPENDGMRRDHRKIMHVFIQKKSEVHDMAIMPKEIRNGTNKIEKTSSNIAQGAGITSSSESEITEGTKGSTAALIIGNKIDSERSNNANLGIMNNSSSSTNMAESELSEEPEMTNKIKKKEMISDGSSSNVAFSSTNASTSSGDQDAISSMTSEV